LFFLDTGVTFNISLKSVAMVGFSNPSITGARRLISKGEPGFILGN
jgi:hypothetical protein